MDVKINVQLFLNVIWKAYCSAAKQVSRISYTIEVIIIITHYIIHWSRSSWTKDCYWVHNFNLITSHLIKTFQEKLIRPSLRAIFLFLLVEVFKYLKSARSESVLSWQTYFENFTAIVNCLLYFYCGKKNGSKNFHLICSHLFGVWRKTEWVILIKYYLDDGELKIKWTYLDPIEGSPEIDDSAETYQPPETIVRLYEKKVVCINGACTIETCVNEKCTKEKKVFSI